MLSNMLDVVSRQHRFSAAELPANQFHGQTAAHHDAGRLGIDPDVVLRSRRDVAFAARRAAHHHAAADLVGDFWVFRQRERDIGQTVPV